MECASKEVVEQRIAIPHELGTSRQPGDQRRDLATEKLEQLPTIMSHYLDIRTAANDGATETQPNKKSELDQNPLPDSEEEKVNPNPTQQRVNLQNEELDMNSTCKRESQESSQKRRETESIEEIFPVNPRYQTLQITVTEKNGTEVTYVTRVNNDEEREMTIGAGTWNNLYIPVESVSGSHAFIGYTEMQDFFIKDLNSKHGTFVFQGMEMPLQAGDIFELGKDRPVQFIVDSLDLKARSITLIIIKMRDMKFKDFENKPQPFVNISEVVLGEGNKCHYRINGNHLIDEHAVISFKDEKCMLKCSEENGIWQKLTKDSNYFRLEKEHTLLRFGLTLCRTAQIQEKKVS